MIYQFTLVMSCVVETSLKRFLHLLRSVGMTSDVNIWPRCRTLIGECTDSCVKYLARISGKGVLDVDVLPCLPYRLTLKWLRLARKGKIVCSRFSVCDRSV
jgi:hypothetical protein